MRVHHWVATAIVLGVGIVVSACAVTIDDPFAEEVDVAEDEIVPRPWIIRPLIIRPNPIDPGRRLLRCLPDPRKRYIARDPEVCAGMRFVCPGGEAFFDRCGCGCFVGLPVDGQPR